MGHTLDGPGIYSFMNKVFFNSPSGVWNGYIFGLQSEIWLQDFDKKLVSFLFSPCEIV